MLYAAGETTVEWGKDITIPLEFTPKLAIAQADAGSSSRRVFVVSTPDFAIVNSLTTVESIIDGNSLKIPFEGIVTTSNVGYVLKYAIYA